MQARTGAPGEFVERRAAPVLQNGARACALQREGRRDARLRINVPRPFAAGSWGQRRRVRNRHGAALGVGPPLRARVAVTTSGEVRQALHATVHRASHPVLRNMLEDSGRGGACTRARSRDPHGETSTPGPAQRPRVRVGVSGCSRRGEHPAPAQATAYFVPRAFPVQVIFLVSIRRLRAARACSLEPPTLAMSREALTGLSSALSASSSASS